MARLALMLLAALLPAPALADCPGAPLSPDALVAQVAAALQAAVPVPYEQVELEPVVALPAPEQAPVVRVKSPWPAARVAVELEWQGCGGARRQLAWFKARAWRRAWVYGREAAQDQPLSAARPALARVDMAQWRAPEAALAAPVGGEWLARAVKAGAPVRQEDLKAPPLVRRNERVTVLVRGHGLQLRAGGMALQFGAAEEWVAVLVDGAEKSMRARVVAPGVVHVEI